MRKPGTRTKMPNFSEDSIQKCVRLGHRTCVIITISSFHFFSGLFQDRLGRLCNPDSCQAEAKDAEDELAEVLSILHGTVALL